jgi:hypothetical protein
MNSKADYLLNALLGMDLPPFASHRGPLSFHNANRPHNVCLATFEELQG